MSASISYAVKKILFKFFPIVLTILHSVEKWLSLSNLTSLKNIVYDLFKIIKCFFYARKRSFDLFLRIKNTQAKNKANELN